MLTDYGLVVKHRMKKMKSMNKVMCRLLQIIKEHLDCVPDVCMKCEWYMERKCSVDLRCIPDYYNYKKTMVEK